MEEEEKYSTNQLLLRSDRITFGTSKPLRQERLVVLPDDSLSKILFGLSSMISTSGLSNVNQIYPGRAAFTFDLLEQRFGIGVSSPQYAIDISSTTGIRITGGGSLVADGKGLVSVPTAALFSTLPSYVFGCNTIPVTSLQSTSATLLGISVPTFALFSTLPTQLFSPFTIPLSSLQQTGSVIATSFTGDGNLLSNIPLANITTSNIGNFFANQFIPLRSLQPSGQLVLTDASGLLAASILSTNTLTANYISSGEISTIRVRAMEVNTDSITTTTFQVSTISAIQVRANAVTATSFYGSGYNLTDINPANLYTTIPANKFGLETISFDILNPFGNFRVLAGSATINAPTSLGETLAVTKQATFNSTIFGKFIRASDGFIGDGSQLVNLPAVSSLSLESTVRGLGTLGYLSTSGTENITSSLVGLGTLGYLSSVQSNLLSTPLLTSSLEGLGTLGFISSTQLTSSLQGLGSLGFISAAQLLSTTAGLVEVSELRSSIEGLGTLGFISAAQLLSTTAGLVEVPELTSTIQGLGTLGFISAAQLLSTTAGLVEVPELTSTIQGLGTLNYVSSTQLTSTVEGLGTSAYISSTQLLSSLEGLGRTGFLSTYVSSFLQFFTSSIQTSSLQLIDKTSLTPGILTLQGGILYVNGAQVIAGGSGDVTSTNLTSTTLGLGTLGYVSTVPSTFISTAALQSTVAGLGTLGYMSTLNSTYTQLFTSSIQLSSILFRDTNNTSFGNLVLTGGVLYLNGVAVGTGGGTVTNANLTSTTLGLGSLGYISTASLQSSFTGLGSLGFISAAQLISTTAGLIELFEITSSFQGLGSLGYVSTASLESSLTGLGTLGFISAAQLISTTAGLIEIIEITSSFQGLGSLGYVSTASLQSSLTGIGTLGYISTAQLISTTAGLVEIGELTSTTAGLGTLRYLSSVPSTFISTAALQSSLAGLGSLGYLSTVPSTFISTATLQSSLIGLGTLGFISAAQLISTTAGLVDHLELTSTVVGLGTLRYLSSVPSTFISTAALQSSLTGLGSLGYVSTLPSTFISSAALQSTLTGLGTLGFISAAQLISTTAGLIDIGELTSTTVGLGTLRYLSSVPSTFISTAALQSSLTGLGSLGYLSSVPSTFISTAALQSSLTGLGSLGYLSTFRSTFTQLYTSSIQLSSILFRDTNNTSFGNLVLTGGVLYLNGVAVGTGGGNINTGDLTSTTLGLGTLGYVSSAQLISTVSGISRVFTTLSANISALQGSNLNFTQGYISSLIVDSLQFGDGTGWATFGAIQAVAVSTIQMNTESLFAGTFVSTRQVLASSVRGDGSALVNLPAISSLSLTSTIQGLGTLGYLSTVPSTFISTAALQSTVTGLGTLRYLSSVPSTFISTAALQSSLAGLGSLGYVSTLPSTFISSVALQSTLTGLGTLGFISAAQLISTTAGLVDHLELTSTVIGLGTLRYLSSVPSTFISTAALQSSLAGLGSLGYLSTVPSTFISTAALQSSLAGLGSLGYLSTFRSTFTQLYTSSIQLSSILFRDTNNTSFGNLVLTGGVLYLNGVAVGTGSGNINTGELTSTTLGLGTLGYLSTVPSTFISTAALQSSLAGLGTFGFISAAQLISTTAGLIEVFEITSSFQGLGSLGYLSTVPSTFISTAALQSTITGLGTLRYFSSVPSTFISTAALQSTVAGLGSLGYLSTLPSTFISTATLQSTLTGLGTLGFISAAQLISTTAGLVEIGELTSTTLGLGTLRYLSSVPSTFISTAALQSTILGLGTIGYISAAQLISTTAGLIDIGELTSTTLGLGTLRYLSSVPSTFISTATLQSSLAGLGSLGYVSTLPSTFISTAALQSTLAGLGTVGFISSATFQSSLIGLGTLGYLSSVPSTFISTAALTSTLDGLSNVAVTQIVAGTGVTISPTGGKGVVTINTTGNLTNYVTNFNQQKGGSITVLTTDTLPAIVASTVITTVGNPIQVAVYGDGDPSAAGWTRVQIYRGTTAIGTQIQLEASAGGENNPFSLSYIDNQPAGTYTYYLKVTTIAGANWKFGEVDGNLMYSLELAGAVPGYISSPSLTSSLQGIGTLGFISTAQLTSSIAGLGTLGYLSTYRSTFTQLFTSSIQLSSIFIRDTTQSNFGNLTLTGGILYLNGTAVGTGSGNVTSTNLISTAVGLGTLGYVSTSQLTSTVEGINAGNFSSINTQSVSTGTMNISTLTFIDINTKANQQLLVSSGVLTLNGQGVGSGSAILGGLTTSDYVTQGLLPADQLIVRGGDRQVQFVTEFDPQNWYNTGTNRLVPTVAGYYYVSYGVWFSTGMVGASVDQYNAQMRKNGNSITISQMITNNTTGTSVEASKLVYMNGSSDYIDFTVYCGSSSNTQLNKGTSVGSGTWYSAALLTNGSGGGNLISTVGGLGSIGYISTSQLTSTVAGLVEIPELTSSLVGLGTFRYLSTVPSTFISTAALQSSLIGLGTLGYLSSIPSTFISTVTLQSTLTGLGTLGFISAAQLISTTAGLVDHLELNSTVIGLGTLRYLSSVPSTFISTVALQSSLIGLGSLGYLSTVPSTFISTVALQSTLTGLGSLGYLSTFRSTFTQLYTSSIQLSSILFRDTNNTSFGNLVLTGGVLYLNGVAVGTGTGNINATDLTSTTLGLGTINYVSSSQLISTVSGISRVFRTLSANISALQGSNLNFTQGYVSSLIVDSLQFGDGTGWATFGAIQAVAVSTIQLNTDSLYTGTFVSTRQVLASSLSGNGSALTNLPAISSLSLTSTIVGLGTLKYLSSDNLVISSVKASTMTVSSLYFTDATTPLNPKPLYVSQGNLWYNSTNLQQPSSLFFSAGQAQFGTASTSAGMYASSFTAANAFISPYMYADSNNFYIKLNNQITFIVNFAGFVGIGRAVPTDNLDVSGQMRSDRVSTTQMKTSSFTGNFADAFNVVVQEV